MLPTYKQTDTAYNRDALPHLKIKKNYPLLPLPSRHPFLLFLFSGFKSEDGDLILNTNLVQFVQLVRTGVFRKMQYVAIIIGESLQEAQVGSNENLAQELKDSLEVRFTNSLFLKINQSIDYLINQ